MKYTYNFVAFVDAIRGHLGELITGCDELEVVISDVVLTAEEAIRVAELTEVCCRCGIALSVTVVERGKATSSTTVTHFDHCPYCGAPMSYHDLYCPSCGAH